MIYISFQLPKKSHIITLWAVYTKLCRHLPVIYHKNGRHHSVLGAFRGPSQQLHFQPPVFSFDTPTMDIDIGAPMDVSPPPAFGDVEPIVPAAREKGKAKALELDKKAEKKESNKPWE